MSLLDMRNDSDFTPTKNSSMKKGEIQSTSDEAILISTGKFNMRNLEMKFQNNNDLRNRYSNTEKDSSLTFRDEEIKDIGNKNAEEYNV